MQILPAVITLIPGKRNPPRRRLPPLLFTAVAAVLLLILVSPVPAAEYSVSPSGGDFVNIQDAVSHAGRGDTIVVSSGTYNETVRIDKALVIRGADTGGGRPVILPDNDGDAVEIASNGCTFSGFVIRNARMLSGIRITTDNNTVTYNTIISGSQGILLDTANNNLIVGNNITMNIRSGITLSDSGNNRIENNSVTGNSVGITLDEYSISNQIFLNNFGNTVNVVSKSASSFWDSGTPLQYRYLGRNQTSRIGNYWSNYQGTDADRNGIGDTPYVIQIGAIKTAVLSVNQDTADSYPLMDPKEYYAGVTSVSLMAPAPAGPTVTPPSAGTGTGDFVPADGLAGVRVPDGNGSWAGLPAAGILGILLVVVFGSAFAVRQNRVNPVKSPASSSDIPEQTRAHAAVSFPVPPADRARPPGSTIVPGEDEMDLPAPTPAAEPFPVPPPARTRPPGSTLVPAEDGTHIPAPTAPQSYFPHELGGKYTDIHLIGRGGIAWVYSAVRKSDGMRVAVKIPISFDEMTGKSFLNEIKAWEMLRHPNIIEITAVNILPVPYVEMEYVTGTLEPVAEPIPVWKAVHIVRGIADALGYAHSLGIIHRDIKPHNILVTQDLTPKITDWGMSKAMATDGRKSSIAGFSLPYAAPEQVSPSEFGRTDARTDIYQLGAMFYELVTGSLPFGGESIVEVCNAIIKETPLKPSAYNPEAAPLDAIILKCLEKDPAKRFQSADELLKALARYLDGIEP